MIDDLPGFDATTAPSGTGAVGRKCKRHTWTLADGGDEGLSPIWQCHRCGAVRDATRSRRARNNGKRGRTAELEVARMVGGRKVGPLGLPWDVELAGYARLQVKKLKSWPSLNEIIGWLDAIPSAPELRGVVVVEAAGQGKHGRSVIVFDTAEWARWHGGDK